MANKIWWNTMGLKITKNFLNEKQPVKDYFLCPNPDCGNRWATQKKATHCCPQKKPEKPPKA